MSRRRRALVVAVDCGGAIHETRADWRAVLVRPAIGCPACGSSLAVSTPPGSPEGDAVCSRCGVRVGRYLRESAE